ncbi:hypothetical protein F5883DRAFT_243836 [Diaporthe sp. PMI_573]|nr:hypothetical protein F5883DRAFT_243836 [Diaporthaceae sp. PMI_573]
MPPKQVKSDPEVKSQESPDLWTIQPVPGHITSPGTGTTSGFGLSNPPPRHPLPVIHETGESYFSSQFPLLQGTAQGLVPDSFPYPNISGIGNFPSASQDPFSFNPSYSTGYYNMNNMSRTVLPSSRNARNQGLGSSGTGAGITKRSSHQHGQTGIATNQAATRAALDMAVNPGQIFNQNQGFGVDLTGMDYPTDSQNIMGLYGSTLNSGLDPNSFALSSYNPFPDVGGGMPQNAQGQDYRNISPVPKFDPDLLSASPDFITPNQYESFGEDEYESKPDSRGVRAQGTPTPAARQRRTSLALADISPATAVTSSPADSSYEAPEQQGSGGGTGSGSGRQPTNPPAYQAHVPPNRIAEAGPVRHPDPEWRPYGVNHWHVFLREPTTLKYLSSTEIKDIREHCYELASKKAASGEDGEDNDEPQPVTEGSPYTTADAQAVWKHCDAYVRRRSQVRNNQAARRSRQRKDAETRYWKAKALEYGAPDHEFDWSLAGESPPAPAPATAPAQGGSSSSRAAAVAGEGGGAVQTRARARRQRQGGEGQVQGQGQGQGQGQIGRGGGRQGQAAARRASAPSSARPDFDFNQLPEYDEDDKRFGNDFDAFTGEY